MPLQSALDLSIWLHSGTLLAAIVYFRKELVGLFKSEERYLLRFLILSTIFTAIVGAPIYLLFVSTFSSVAGEAVIGVVGVLLIVTGLIYRSATPRTRQEERTNDTDSAVAGLLQGLAALPGISRSGITTSTLIFRGFSPQAALRLSFMMSIFAVAAAEIGLQLRGGFVISGEALIAMAGAFAAGIVTIGLLLKGAHWMGFWKFLIFLGALSLVPLLFYVV